MRNHEKKAADDGGNIDHVAITRDIHAMLTSEYRLCGKVLLIAVTVILKEK